MDTGPIGMMNGAYFKSRNELLQWINDLLCLNVRKVEECASGAHHCQVFDALFPGKVPMRKVKYDAKYDYEFVANYKVLQDVFLKVGISKVIPVDRLIKARYQDNLEFLQWVHEYYLRNQTSAEYNAVKRRQVCRGGPKLDKGTTSTKSRPTVPTSRPIRSTSNSKAPLSVSTAPATNSVGNSMCESDIEQIVSDRVEIQLAEASKEWESQEQLRVEQLTKMKAMLTEMEGERDYYYKKMEVLDGWLSKVLDEEHEKSVQLDVETLQFSKGKQFIADRVLKLLYEEITPQQLEQSEGAMLVDSHVGTEKVPGVSSDVSMSHVSPKLSPSKPAKPSSGSSTLESIFDQIQQDELLKSRAI